MTFRLTFGREAVIANSPISQRARFGLNVLQGNADATEKMLSHRALNHLLGALYAMNVDYLRAYPQTPRLYESGIHYMEEPPGQEEWQDIATVRRMGYGDCVPLDTLVRVHNPLHVPVFGPNGQPESLSTEPPYFDLPIEMLRIGQQVWADASGRLVSVKDVAHTGMKPLLVFYLDGRDTPLRCSPEHRVFLAHGEIVRAESVREGQSLFATPTEARVVRRIEPGLAEECLDITTSDGGFFVAGPDVRVHNCEDLASWLAAERTVKDGVVARPVFLNMGKRPDGANLYHIVVQHYDPRTGRPGPNRFAPRAPFIEDPSRVLGMK